MKQQRGFIPDAIDNRRVILFKACKKLRLTNEIRLATFMAKEAERSLVIFMPKGSSVAPSLEEFAQLHGVEIIRK